MRDKINKMYRKRKTEKETTETRKQINALRNCLGSHSVVSVQMDPYTYSTTYWFIVRSFNFRAICNSWYHYNTVTHLTKCFMK